MGRVDEGEPGSFIAKPRFLVLRSGCWAYILVIYERCR